MAKREENEVERRKNNRRCREKKKRTLKEEATRQPWIIMYNIQPNKKKQNQKKTKKNKWNKQANRKTICPKETKKQGNNNYANQNKNKNKNLHILVMALTQTILRASCTLSHSLIATNQSVFHCEPDSDETCSLQIHVQVASCDLSVMSCRVFGSDFLNHSGGRIMSWRSLWNPSPGLFCLIYIKGSQASHHSPSLCLQKSVSATRDLAKVFHCQHGEVGKISHSWCLLYLGKL